MAQAISKIYVESKGTKIARIAKRNLEKEE